MSKVTKRKITVESPGSKHNSNILPNKESQRRQSVFERLGTKTGTPISINTSLVGQQLSTIENFCRHWNQNGTCPYGKNCVFVNTHTLISPSKRAQKKDLDPKQSLEGLKRLHSTVVKRGSPEVNWDSWDQTSLEYEDEKVLEKRRQLLQRELELQMRREEGVEEHHRHRHNPAAAAAQKKTLSSSSSTSVSSTTSDSSSSSDDSSSDSSSTSGVADSKRRRAKAKKAKRASTSSLSDIERKKIRENAKSMHKDRSPSNISKKSSSSRDKRAFTPPRKSASSSKMAGRKKSLSPAHRRHISPPPGKNKPSTSKSSSGSRHNQSPRPPSKRSTSAERKDKHRRSPSPRRGGKPAKERSPRPARQDTRRRKDSPADNRARNSSHSRLPDTRLDDRKKDDDRSRSKDDRRQDRKAVPERDKRDHDDTRAREKAREAAREKEREEALERCRERQREREQLAKDKDRVKTKDERDREPKKRDYDKSLPPLMSLSTHGQPERKIADRDRDRGNKDRKDRDKEKEKERDRERDRIYDRGLEKPDRSRPLEKERMSDKLSDRERDKDRPRERDILNERVRDKIDRDRSFERNFDRGANEPSERSFDREKDRPSKNLDRSRDRDFDRDKATYERVGDNRRSFEKVDRTSLENMVRDRALDRVMEERNVERGRERFDREGRFDRRGLAAEDKGYESPYDSRRDRQRYGPDGSERQGMFKDLSPSTREDTRGMRHNQGFGEEKRRGGPRGGGGWEARGGYDDPGPGKSRDWDYPESRRDWDTRNRHGDWEAGVEGDEWGRYGGPGADWAGGEWREEWPTRPPRHGPREDQTVVSSNHIVVRDANIEETGRRSQVLDPVEKDPLVSGDFKKDSSDSGAEIVAGVKRPREREEGEAPPEVKKPRLEEAPPPATAPLEEVLSDISDDPDEILNREDVDVPMQEDCGLEEEVRSSASVQPTSQELDQRLLEDRPSEEENIDNLDFEEISDEELEEEARANRNKGVGDALGVDWASLVAESRGPRPEAETGPGAARRRWRPAAVLARIGVSLQYAGRELFDEIQQELVQTEEGKPVEPSQGLLHPVASLHVTLRERQARRKSLFSGMDTFKRALSARTDIVIRRQLCNLPVSSLEMQQSTGFCQWVV